MKKKIFIICIIAIIIIVTYNVFLKKFCPDAVDDISINIDDVKIENILDMNPSYDVIFREYNFPENLKKDIENNPDNYVVASIHYLVTNQSKELELKDIRFYPKKSLIIKAFNEGNGTYYIFAKPLKSTGMRQYMVLNTNGKTNEEIYNMLLEEKIEMVYFTGSFMINTGHGYSGIGKHKYEFKIKDVMKNSS